MAGYVGPTHRLDISLAPAEQETIAAIQLRLEIQDVVAEAMRRRGLSPENDPFLLQRIIRRAVARLAEE